MFQISKNARYSPGKGEALSREMKRAKGQILCVEDDQDSAEMMTALLGLSDYEVITADSVAEALELARRGGFDLYLLDNWLKDGTGVELCQQIRSFDSRTPILFYSGAAYDSDIKQAMKAGAQGYMVKPSSLENLATTISRLVRKT